MEHRWGQRRSVDLAVSVTALPGAIGMGRLRDVSASGAFIATQLDLPLFSLVQIELPGGAASVGAACEGHAYVVRKSPGGIGIEWSTFAREPQPVPATRLPSRPVEASRQSMRHTSLPGRSGAQA